MTTTTKLNNGVHVFANGRGAIKATNRTQAEKQQAKLAAEGKVSTIIQPRLGPVFFQMVACQWEADNNAICDCGKCRQARGGQSWESWMSS